MANHRPDRAALHADGFGYLIMGAQPGNVPGMIKVDPANPGQAVQAWLGTEGPACWPCYDEDMGVPDAACLGEAGPRGAQMAGNSVTD
jgi:hypothetical protein